MDDAVLGQPLQEAQRYLGAEARHGSDGLAECVAFPATLEQE